MRRSAILLLILTVLPVAGRAGERAGLDDRVRGLLAEDAGLQFGIHVVQEGTGILYSTNADQPRFAASAIKTAILVDLLAARGDQLHEIPEGVETLLRAGTHPAFAGFPREELDRARRQLPGMTYLELAKVMMGRTTSTNGVYNAACNVIMIKLGGPEAISRRFRALDPAFGGVEINRYMQQWTGDGDNVATPAALVSLYSMASSRSLPGLGPGEMSILRDLLLEEGDGGPGSVYEKKGTLYPDPMVRVHAGFLERDAGNLVYAVMGEITGSSAADPADRFVRLLNSVDEVTLLCRDLRSSTR